MTFPSFKNLDITIEQLGHPVKCDFYSINNKRFTDCPSDLTTLTLVSNNRLCNRCSDRKPEQARLNCFAPRLLVSMDNWLSII